jgi:hypothetical protein
VEAANSPLSRERGNGRPRGATKSDAAVVLEEAQSAALRDKLLAEIADLTCVDSAVTWAVQTLGAKNSLVAADARLLEEAFEQKLSGLSSPTVSEVLVEERAAPQEEPGAAPAGSPQLKGIDKSVLAVAAPRRYRHRDHLRYGSLPRVGIATGSTCAMSPNRRALSAAASPRTPTTSHSDSLHAGARSPRQHQLPCLG